MEQTVPSMADVCTPPLPSARKEAWSRFYLCRRHAIQRCEAVRVCPVGEQWVHAVCLCVDNSAITDSEFRATLSHKRRCPGGTVTASTELERFRFCESVIGDLQLDGLSSDTDYSALRFIKTISGQLTVTNCQGLKHLSDQLPRLYSLGQGVGEMSLQITGEDCEG